MELFVRESGAAGAAAVVFLHGAEHSSQSWQPVVKRMQRYRCLVPDLPQHGESVQGGPFDMDRAASAVAELIRSRVDAGRVHLVGHSLGAQVGVHLLATEPALVERAVLCGVIINTMPGVWLTRLLAGAVAGISRSVEISRAIREKARLVGTPSTNVADDGNDAALMPAAQISQIVVASAGFTIPEGLGRSVSPTLFLTGARELPFVRQSAAALGRRMPNGVDGVARGMDHDWPLQYPALFARTVDSWLCGTPLPTQIALSNTDPG